MAQIWLWRDGDSRTTGGPLVELPLADCVTKLRIARKDYCGDLCTPPRFETFEHPPTRGVRVVMGLTLAGSIVVSLLLLLIWLEARWSEPATAV